MNNTLNLGIFIDEKTHYFPIIHNGYNSYFLKTISSHFSLNQVLQQWMLKCNKINEPGYKNLQNEKLEEALSQYCPDIGENLSLFNVDTIFDTDLECNTYADRDFIQDCGILSTQNDNIDINYSIHDYVLTGDTCGYIKEWSIESRKQLKNWGKIHQEWVGSIAITKDGKYIFTGGYDGYLKQWLIDDSKQLYKDWGKVHEAGIWSMLISPNNQQIFTADGKGQLNQWVISTQKLHKKWGIIHKNGIWSMAITPDSIYLFIGDREGYQEQWVISNSTLLKNWGEIHGEWICSITITPDGRTLFIGGDNGNLKEFEICKYGSNCLNWGKVHNDWISCMIVSPDGSKLFLGGKDGNLQQINLLERKIEYNWGTINEDMIKSIIITS